MDKPLQKRLGARIAACREAAGLTQEGLAGRVRVATESISRIERGAMGPTLSTLKRIADALGLEMRDLFDLPGDKPARAKPLERLSKMLSGRTDAEIELVTAVTAEILKRRPARSGRQ